jgi:sulfite reductase alpha subunit-like flavoprotein
MSASVIFSLIAAVISAGGVFIAIGVFKSKINQNTETGKAHSEQITNLASKTELSTAVKHIDDHIETSIKRSDELLSIIKARAEEDRTKSQGQYHEFYSLLNNHEKRIGALETQQTAMTKSLDEIKTDIKSGFRDLQNELKELRKQV